MPPLARWHEDIIAPPISFSEGNSVLKLCKLHMKCVEGVLCAVGPAHERGFVAAPVIEFDAPILVHCFVGGVAVHMLTLGHVDTSDTVAHLLGLPG